MSNLSSGSSATQRELRIPEDYFQPVGLRPSEPAKTSAGRVDVAMRVSRYLIRDGSRTRYAKCFEDVRRGSRRYVEGLGGPEILGPRAGGQRQS